MFFFRDVEKFERNIWILQKTTPRGLSVASYGHALFRCRPTHVAHGFMVPGDHATLWGDLLWGLPHRAGSLPFLGHEDGFPWASPLFWELLARRLHCVHMTPVTWWDLPELCLNPCTMCKSILSGRSSISTGRPRPPCSPTHTTLWS